MEVDNKNSTESVEMDENDMEAFEVTEDELKKVRGEHFFKGGAMNVDSENDNSVKRQKFPQMTNQLQGVSGSRSIKVVPNRISYIKKFWNKIYDPIVQHMKLQIRMNLKTNSIEMRTCDMTEEIGALQKATDFLNALMLGFELEDSIALLRLDDLYVDSFEVKDVKTLSGDHLSRAIGRLAGRGGKVKFTIENATRTRIVVADTKIHVLGSFANIKIARDALVDLIMGSPPAKVYSRLRTIVNRQKNVF